MRGVVRCEANTRVRRDQTSDVYSMFLGIEDMVELC